MASVCSRTDESQHVKDLQGRVAAVTGGASGIGLAMARRFGAEGMAIAIADIEDDALSAAAEGLAADGVEVLASRVDVTDAEAVVDWAIEVRERFGGVHVVCNNAGVGPPGAVSEMSLEDFRWIVDVNLFGVLHGVRAFLPTLIAQGEGHIVNTASVSGLLTQPGLSAYNVSKFGVVALSESLFYELELMGVDVGVSILCPAWVKTRIYESERNRPSDVAGSGGPLTTHVRKVIEGFAAASHRSPDDVAARTVEGVKENRFYIVTHPGIMKFVKHRHQDVEESRNPSVQQGF